MNCIVVWLDPNTTEPSVIGPYESDLVYDDAALLRQGCFKVVVCQITNPEQARVMEFLSQQKAKKA